ncbi:hypothetical protein [Streptomyces chrestomyceticus]|uniref:hypothetical protein n=1 Tax=Streptomyces chrestomyceticus TaxID=68185 RepID=UPI0033C1370A
MVFFQSPLSKAAGSALLAGALVAGTASTAAASEPAPARQDLQSRSNWGKFPMTSGPGAAAIVQKFYLTFPTDTGLRAGNAIFGQAHIARGGKKGHKYNHELSSYAKSLWVKAMENTAKGSQTTPFKGGTFSTYNYTLKSGTKRTMCVLVDRNDYTYAGKNYGHKGIITAYWVNGHIKSGECSGRD